MLVHFMKEKGIQTHHTFFVRRCLVNEVVSEDECGFPADQQYVCIDGNTRMRALKYM